MSMYANCQYFNPLWLAPKAWLDPWDPNANGVQPANSTASSAWVDKSRNANSCDQATGANQPTWLSSAINSKPAFNFSGSPVFFNWKSSSTMAIQNSPFEIYIVALTSFQVTATFLISSAAKGWEIDYDPGTPANGAAFLNPFATIAAGVGTNHQYNDGVPHIMSARSQTGAGNPSYCRVDRVDGTPINGGLNNTNTALVLGKRGDSAFYFQGSMGDVVLVNYQLTTVQRNLLENWLKNRGGTP